MPVYWVGDKVVGESSGEEAGHTTDEYQKAAEANYQSTGTAFSTSAVLGLSPQGQLYVAQKARETVLDDPSEHPGRNSGTLAKMKANVLSGNTPYSVESGIGGNEPSQESGILAGILKAGALPVIIGIALIILIVSMMRK